MFGDVTRGARMCAARAAAMTVRVYTVTPRRGHVGVVRRGGREVWRSRVVPYGAGGLAWALAWAWVRGHA